MTQTSSGLPVGIKLKEIATHDIVYHDCTLLNSDAVGIAFEVERTVSDAGGDVEVTVSQLLIPWTNVKHVVIMQAERS